MRLIICAMPLIGLAMIVSNCSIRLRTSDVMRSVSDPEAAAINRKFWGDKLVTNCSNKNRLLTAVLSIEDD